MLLKTYPKDPNSVDLILCKVLGDLLGLAFLHSTKSGLDVLLARTAFGLSVIADGLSALECIHQHLGPYHVLQTEIVPFVSHM